MRTTLKLLSAVALVLAACNDEDPASLRVVHASPGAPAVDVFADNVLLISNLAYGQVSPYVDVEAGTYTLVVRVSGTDTTVFESDPVSLLEDVEITAIATGTVGSANPQDAFRVITLTEGFVESGDAALVRVVHASPDAPTVSIDVGDDGSIEVADLERFADTGPAGIPLPPSQSLQIGIVANNTRVTAFTTPTLPVDAELIVIAIGNVSDLPRLDTGFSLLVIGPDGVVALVRQNPTVYALHASPDAPAVDVRIEGSGELLYGDLGFGELVPAQVIPGDYTLQFFPTGLATQVATTQLTDLLAGERYLAVAAGMLNPVGNEAAFQVVSFRDEFVVDQNPRLRVVHVSPDAPVVDISTVSGNTLSTPLLIRNLAFAEATAAEGLAVPAASNVLVGIAPTTTTTPVATFSLDTTTIDRAFALAAGLLSPGAGQQGFRLFVVETAVTPWTITTVQPN